VFSNFDAVVLKRSAQLHGTGEILWSLARFSRLDLDDVVRGECPPLILNALHSPTQSSIAALPDRTGSQQAYFPPQYAYSLFSSTHVLY